MCTAHYTALTGCNMQDSHKRYVGTDKCLSRNCKDTTESIQVIFGRCFTCDLDNQQGSWNRAI